MSATSVIAAPFALGGYPALDFDMFQAHGAGGGKLGALPEKEGPTWPNVRLPTAAAH